MKTVLIVEDNDDIREVVAELLREHGYDVREAENGKVALDMLPQLSEPPCLMLLDLMMPVMGGIELLHILQQSGRLEHMPVIVLSAVGNAAQVPEADRFMRKPVNFELMLCLVDELCHQASA